jgi:hypothetical protein
VSDPPVSAAASRPSIRQDAKPGREFEGGRTVRVFSEDGFLVARLHSLRDAEQIRRLLAAPNAVPVRKQGGSLVGIKLQSIGDDRGQSGEQHGRSTVTTQRIRNKERQFVGTHTNLEHKQETCRTWGNLAVSVTRK